MISIVSHLRKVAEFIIDSFTAKNAPLYVKLNDAKRQLAFKPALSMNLINEALGIMARHPFKDIKIDTTQGAPVTLYTKYTDLVNAAKGALEEFMKGKIDKKVDFEKNIEDAQKLIEDVAPAITKEQMVVRD
jgi:ribosomal protein L4